MERSNHKHISFYIVRMLFALLCWSLSFSVSLPASAQVSFQNLVYRAYVEGRMNLWESTLGTMEFEYSRNPNPDLLYDILLARYGLIGYYLGIDDNSTGRAILNKASENLEVLEQAAQYEAEAMLFRAAFNAFRISLRPWLGVRLGPQSQRLINDAIEIKPEYPRGWVEKGNLMYFAPAMFGGSKPKAIEHYSKAIELMEHDMQNNHRWLYLSTLVSLANAYEYTGQHQKAIATLEKALVYEPGFVWVKDELLPELKMKSQ